MDKPLRSEYKQFDLLSEPFAYAYRMEFGDCTVVILERSSYDVEVRLWRANELVFHTYASDIYMARVQVADWRDKNHNNP